MDGYVHACVHVLVCARMHVCVKTAGTTNKKPDKSWHYQGGSDDLHPLFLLFPLPSGLGSSWVPWLPEDKKSCDRGSSCQMCVPWGAGIQRSVFLTGKLQA